MVQIKKEIILKKENNFITKYGYNGNNKIPEVIYLRTKAKITPLKKSFSYEKELDKVKENFNDFLLEEIENNPNFDKKFLFNIDISSKSVKYGKISNVRYDIYLKPLKKDTLISNQKLFEQFSLKVDRQLINLLQKYKIECV